MEKIIIPFGEECYTCQSIDIKFSNNPIRICGFPFDYVGYSYIESIYTNLNDLKLDNYSITINDFSKQLLKDEIYFMQHNLYEFKYWHDEIKDTIDVTQFIEKYNRRYERLKYYLQNCNDITIISVNHYDNIYNKIYKQNSIYKLFNLLQTFNSTIKFISINFGEKINDIHNLQFVNLPVNYDIPFIESKEEFTKNLYEYIKTIV